MTWFNNDIRVANTATPSFQQEVNTGAYGWTGVDQGHYNQLIQYVEECRVIWKDIELKTEIFDKVEEEAESIQRAITFVYDASKDVRDISDLVKTEHELNQRLVVEMRTLAANVKTAHDDFIPKYQDFLIKYEEIINKFP
ncbi:MAG: hypothetical protein ACRC6V_18520 [Bacteroidales bacterium]